MRHFYCTHFDSNYLGHAKNLLYSLSRNDRDFKLFMFCFDQSSYDSINELNNQSVVAIFYKELEFFNPDLKIAKRNRNFVEYFYTCSPAICNYVICNFLEVDLITYLDSDLYFFDSPLPIFNELNGYSVGIIEHKFNFFTKRNKKYGNFNVGWVSFRRDLNGLACLNNWSERCIEWCYQKLESNRYADQKYLDYWQKEFKNVKVISNIGANLAIWNIRNYKISLKHSKIYINDSPLIFYHFANLKQLEKYIFSTGLSRVLVSCKGIIRENIYLPYLQEFLINQRQNSLSIPKKEIDYMGLITFARNISRKIRAFFFNDIIKIK